MERLIHGGAYFRNFTVSEKFSLKNPKIYKERMSSLTFCHPAVCSF